MKEAKESSYQYWIIIAFLTVVILFGGLWGLNRLWHPIPDNAAAFGDSFGMANAFFSALAFAFLIVTAMMQRKELQYQRLELSKTHEELEKSNVSQIVINLFNEFRNEDQWIEARKVVSDAKKNGKIEFESVRKYSHFLNHFGFLLEHKYVDIESLYETFGKSVMDFWGLVKPTIYEKRNNSNNIQEYYPYQYHLEYLDYRLRKYFPTGRKHVELLLKEIHEYNLEQEKDLTIK